MTTVLLSLRGRFTSCWPRGDGVAPLSDSVRVNITCTSCCKMLREILEGWCFQNLAALLGQTGQLDLVYFQNEMNINRIKKKKQPTQNISDGLPRMLFGVQKRQAESLNMNVEKQWPGVETLMSA